MTYRALTPAHSSNRSHTSVRRRALGRSGLLMCLGGALLAGHIGCSAPVSQKDTSEGSGGAYSTGGGGTGGFSATGGGGGTGGFSATGGVPATGGAANTGGVPATGGVANTGGSSTGGSSGSCTSGQQDNDGDGTCSAACAATTCINGGTCDDSSGTATCTCTTGWGGTNCGTPDCTGVSCDGEGTGTCNDAGSTLACDCDDGYQDNDDNLSCDTACGDDTCDGNRVCNDDSGTAECSCAPGYLGASCDQCDTDNFYEPDGNGGCSRPSCLTDGSYSFADDFTEGDACWPTTTGTWSLINDGSQAFQQTGTGDLNFATAHPGPFTDVRIDARVKVISWGSGGSSARVGVFARYANTSTSYGAVLAGDGRLYTLENNGQRGSSWRPGGSSFPVDTWYDISLELTSSGGTTTIKLIFDGTEYENTDSSELGPGGVALGTTGGATAIFDDVIVTMLD